MYFQGSHFAIVVFSITDSKTLTDAKSWVDELHKNCDTGRFPLLYLVGNMADLSDRRNVQSEEAQRLAEELNAQYFETSALSGQNIPELFADIADHVASKVDELPASDLVAARAPQGRSQCC
jgi:GTPase SAR1 family protein